MPRLQRQRVDKDMRKILYSILTELQGIRKDNAAIYKMLCLIWDQQRITNSPELKDLIGTNYVDR